MGLLRPIIGKGFCVPRSQRRCFHASLNAGLVATVSDFAFIVLKRCLSVSRPERHEPPSHDGEFALTGLTVKPHYWLETLGRDVERRSEVRFIDFVEDIDVVGLHPFSDALLVPASAIATTHSALLDRFDFDRCSATKSGEPWAFAVLEFM